MPGTGSALGSGFGSGLSSSSGGVSAGGGLSKARPPASAAILTVSLELLAVGVFTLMAGAGPDMGSLTLLFIIGLWLLFLITNPTVITTLEGKLGVI